MTQDFPDHFSGHADVYARHRPSYPAALFTWLAQLPAGHTLCWDCGTGSGQAAIGLAPYFDQVVATDASRAQLAHARPAARVVYTVALAERSGLAEGSVDLVVAAAAAHWFDAPAFHAEVRRVCRPGAHIALWTYGAGVRVEPRVDAILRALADGPLAPHWPPQFRLVRGGYRDLPFPFDEVETPALCAQARWSLAELLGFVRSWSGHQRCLQATGADPLVPLEAALSAAWGDEETRQVQLPLAIRAGAVR